MVDKSFDSVEKFSIWEPHLTNTFTKILILRLLFSLLSFNFIHTYWNLQHFYSLRQEWFTDSYEKLAAKYLESWLATHHAGGTGERCSSYSFLTSALDRGEWSPSRPIRTLPRRKNPRYPFDRRLGGSRSWSRHRGYRKNSLPLPGIKPWSSRL
jgi:hypothetical protein